MAAENLFPETTPVSPKATVGPTSADAAVEPDKPSLPYRLLQKTHPKFDLPYYQQLRALYVGGRKLLGDPKLMAQVFPRHRDESNALYGERCARAYYLAYCAEIIDHLVAALMAAPVRIQTTDEKGEAVDDLPKFWQDFVNDCSPPNGERRSLQKLLRRQILNSLQTRISWTLLDLPKSDPMGFANQLEQEKAGALNVYAVPIKAECVLDWEEDANRELEWAVIRTVEMRRPNLSVERNRELERWVYYDRTHWEIYEIEHLAGAAVQDETPVKMVASGDHPFERVPLVRLCLPKGLWAMNKLEGPAREHFNKRCALSWGELQSVLPELYEFLGPEGGAGVPVSAAQQDVSRALAQVRGQGYVQVRGSNDDARYIGPGSEAFRHVMESCRDIRDEMHRVMHKMALSTDNSAAALGRSGESKGYDRLSESVVAGALGEILREHAVNVMDMAARGRREVNLVGKWRATGANKFDQKEASNAIEDAVNLSTVSINSPTFWKLLHSELARLVLSASASKEDLEKIAEELEKNGPPEMLGGAGLPPGAPPGMGAPKDEDLEEEPEEEPRPAPKSASRNRVVRQGKG